MLTHQSSVFEIEGFSFDKHPFIVKKAVRGPEKRDTLLFEPPYCLHLVAPRAQKVYSWVTQNLHRLSWDSGFYNYTILFCFVKCLMFRLPDIVVLSKCFDNCNFLHNFFSQVFDSNHYNYPKESELGQNLNFDCWNHQDPCLRDHCAREKIICF